MAKKQQLKAGGGAGETLTQKNIRQWSAHCDKLESRADTLTDEERDDLQFRRLQVNRWLQNER